jgi:alkylated DNA repair protein (DNA oxidative demethylase)
MVGAQAKPGTQEEENSLSVVDTRRLVIRDGMVLLRRFADTASLLPLIDTVAAASPFRHMHTPGGRSMSVAMTNCGRLGWLSDPRGYRYEAIDPITGAPWPAMPEAFMRLAAAAAAAAGFAEFSPDACLINRYAVGARLTAHQDRDERDFAQPIVSVSLGLPATFFVTLADRRSGPTRSVRLEDADVVVWGGPARLAFHGIREVSAGEHPLTGPYRYNLTLRRAG